MMLVSRFSLLRKSIFSGVFGDKDAGYFWQARFLPRWLPLLLGVVLGLSSAALIGNGVWYFAVVLALVVPIIILFIRYPFAAVLIWVLLMPFFGTDPTVAGRSVFWVIHRAMIPAVLILLILRDGLGTNKRKEPVRLGWADLSVLFFLGLTLANIALFSLNERAYYNFYDMLFVPLCMYWLIRLLAPEEEDLKRLLWVAFIVVVAQSIVGLLSWFAPGLLLAQWRTRLEGERTVGTVRNVAVYTSTILLLAVLLFQYGMNCKAKLIRYSIYAVFCLVLFLVFLSFSRASWIGGLIVLTGLMALYPRVIITFVLGLVILVYSLSGSVLEEQITWGYERLTGEKSQRSAEGRVIGNTTSIRMIEAEPFFGWGYFNREIFDRPFASSRIALANISGNYNKSSHHTYLTIMVELGLIGFFFYIFPVVWWLWLSVKFGRRLPKAGFWSWRLLVALWLVMLHMFVVSSFMDMVRHFPFGTTLWWMTLGFIASMIQPYLKHDDVGVPHSTTNLVWKN